ncbi:MAG: hypothetical protein A2V77_10155 [Anaeromyxobacter sp. RBG_16_69_14]|nr:MAG: hypothetical protein A2V77_10155 [Anaeromyxobacter sp. RBG_16_69_14]
MRERQEDDSATSWVERTCPSRTHWRTTSSYFASWGTSHEVQALTRVPFFTGVVTGSVQSHRVGLSFWVSMVRQGLSSTRMGPLSLPV